MKRIVFTVTNDLSFDQRMDRICSTLAANGYECVLIGRKRRHSLKLEPKDYEQVRIPCLFEKGKLFYLEYNLKLWWYLLFLRMNALCAIDLDTILPVWAVSRLRRKPFIYDAHEYFTEMEEIVSRPLIQKAWKVLERFMMKRIQHAYTISEGYAEMYKKRYGVAFQVIRNVPFLNGLEEIATDQRYLIYQGALNVGRGLEETLKAMPQLKECTLKVFGDGPNAGSLRSLAKSLQLNGQVEFKGMLRPEDLKPETHRAWLGLTLFSETGLHHRHSLANRFFDYLHAGVPQIAMDYPEYRAFNQKHEVAVLIPELTPEAIAKAVHDLYYDDVHYQRLEENCRIASKEHCWEKESVKLLAFYNALPI